MESIEAALMRENVEWFFNPMSLPASWLLGLLIFKFSAEELLNFTIDNVLKRIVKAPLLPGRDKVGAHKGLEVLEFKDYWFLFVNQFVEFVFVLHLLQMAWLQLPKLPSELTLSNSVLAIYATFLLDDFIYYFAHRIMHIPAIYPYIHKHHHRQPLPFRGYFDAANESPIEQVIGLGCVWITILLVEPVFGFHAAAVILFFGIYAAMAMLNHLPYDVKFSVPGFTYAVKAHESHHRLLRCNYAQNTMFWDRLFGTWKE